MMGRGDGPEHDARNAAPFSWVPPLIIMVFVLIVVYVLIPFAVAIRVK